DRFGPFLVGMDNDRARDLSEENLVQEKLPDLQIALNKNAALIVARFAEIFLHARLMQKIVEGVCESNYFSARAVNRIGRAQAARERAGDRNITPDRKNLHRILERFGKGYSWIER